MCWASVPCEDHSLHLSKNLCCLNYIHSNNDTLRYALCLLINSLIPTTISRVRIYSWSKLWTSSFTAFNLSAILSSQLWAAPTKLNNPHLSRPVDISCYFWSASWSTTSEAMTYSTFSSTILSYHSQCSLKISGIGVDDSSRNCEILSSKGRIDN